MSKLNPEFCLDSPQFMSSLDEPRMGEIVEALREHPTVRLGGVTFERGAVASAKLSASSEHSQRASTQRDLYKPIALSDAPAYARGENWEREFESEAIYLAYRRNQHRVRIRGHEPELLEGSLRSMGFRNISGRYFLVLEERAAADWVPLVASMFTTDQPMETYKFLGAAPNMQKWAGERRRQQLTDFGIKVFTDKFETTVEVDIDDWRRDKTGQARQRVLNLADKAAALPQRLLTQLILDNPTAYDNVALFATTHSVGLSGTQSNDLSASASSPDGPSSAEMVTAILAAIQALIGMKDDLGDPINADAQQFVVMVPTKYYSSAVAAWKNEFTSAGVSNTLKNTGLNITIAHNPRLTGTAATAGRRFYTFRTDAGVRALIWQDEEISDAFKVLGPDSDNGFWRESLAFGSKRLSACVPGRFELVTRSTFS